MAKRFMQRCSTSLIIRKMQIELTTRYSLTPIRMEVIQMTKDSSVDEDMEERRALYSVARIVNWFSNYGKNMEVSQKLINRSTIWCGNSISGYVPKMMKTEYWRDAFISTFIIAIIHNSQDTKQLKCPSVEEWIKKIWYIPVIIHIWIPG